MDIYDRLIKDHERQRDLAKKLADTSGDSKERRELFAAFKAEVEAHADAEEQTFYAALIAEPDGQEQARHGIAEHQAASKIVAELADADMSSGGWLQRFETLKDKIIHHLEEEEKEIFPKARAVLSDEAARQLVDDFDDRKSAELKEH